MSSAHARLNMLTGRNDGIGSRSAMMPAATMVPATTMMPATAATTHYGRKLHGATCCAVGTKILASSSVIILLISKPLRARTETAYVMVSSCIRYRSACNSTIYARPSSGTPVSNVKPLLNLSWIHLVISRVHVFLILPYTRIVTEL